MRNVSDDEKLNRHALVVAIWSPFILVAAIAMQIGVNALSPVWISITFVVILMGFVCHIIVNTALSTEFTQGETALGGACFVLAILVFAGFNILSYDAKFAILVLPISAGFSSLIGAVVIYLLIAYGPRKTLEKFDIIRNNNEREASRLVHRGGRR